MIVVGDGDVDYFLWVRTRTYGQYYLFFSTGGTHLRSDSGLKISRKVFSNRGEKKSSVEKKNRRSSDMAVWRSRVAVAQAAHCNTTSPLTTEKKDVFAHNTILIISYRHCYRLLALFPFSWGP
jgi:hypothetical protein